jgi:hypothetical protein
MQADLSRLPPADERSDEDRQGQHDVVRRIAVLVGTYHHAFLSLTHLGEVWRWYAVYGHCSVPARRRQARRHSQRGRCGRGDA